MSDRKTQFVDSLLAADPESALVFWRSRQWAERDRASVRRLVRTVPAIAGEVLR